MTGRAWDERDDAELVRLAQGTSGTREHDDAVAALCHRYQDRVYLWCLRHTGRREQAIDLAQETLLAALRSLPGFDGRAKFSSWLFAIARNRCVSVIRRRTVWTDPDVELDDLRGPAPDPADLVAELDDEERALEFLNRVLDDEERLAFWLRYYEGFPVDEITRRMELHTSSGARGLLQRARRKLDAALAERRRISPEGPR
jgi:RNA polymerase sigma-70 factor, ECF subfamily